MQVPLLSCKGVRVSKGGQSGIEFAQAEQSETLNLERVRPYPFEGRSLCLSKLSFTDFERLGVFRREAERSSVGLQKSRANYRVRNLRAQLQ